MRIAVYGGSFNPPHVGHAMVAAWLRWTGRAEAVWLVPVYRHAFEDWHGKTLAPFDQRVSWCEALAADVGGGVEVCTVEAELPTPSYTIDTLRSLAEAHPEHRFRLVVGADALPQLPQWRDWGAIEAEFSPVVVGRQGYEPVPDSVAFPGVSSTEIRQRLARGEPVSHLLTQGVAAMLAADSPFSPPPRGA